MNKEEIENIKNKTKGILHILKYNRFWNYFEQLQQENKQLNERIVKSIELLNWVKEVKDKFTLYNKNEKDYIDKLLEILKGDSNE